MKLFKGDYVGRVEKLERDLVHTVAQQLGIKEAKVTERQVLDFVNAHPDEFEGGENLERVIAYVGERIREKSGGSWDVLECCGGGWSLENSHGATCTGHEANGGADQASVATLSRTSSGFSAARRARLPAIVLAP